MPEAIAEIVEPLTVVGVEHLVLGIKVAHVGEILVQAQLVILACFEHGGLERSEATREFELTVVGERLVVGGGDGA